jgi:tRNA-modifying protein YgfZ
MSRLYMHIGHPAAWVEVTGEDSLTFLQGQSSNDLKRTGPSPASYTLWLDRKGKILADSFVLQDTPERFFLFSYSSPAATIIERLEAYIIADDVTLTDRTGQTAFAALWGEGAAQALAPSQLETPLPATFTQREHQYILHGRHSRGLNLDVVATGADPAAQMSALSAAVLQAGGKLVDSTVLDRERIESRIPSVPADAGPKDLPQEANLEEDAISYHKGCYLGQEVMARIRAMGQVRRTLAQVRLVAAAEGPLPMPLYDGPREVGSLRTLTAAAPFTGLVLIRKDILEKTQLFSLAPNAPPTVAVLHP